MGVELELELEVELGTVDRGPWTVAKNPALDRNRLLPSLGPMAHTANTDAFLRSGIA